MKMKLAETYRNGTWITRNIKRDLVWRRFPVDWIQDGGENDFGQVDGKLNSDSRGL